MSTQLQIILIVSVMLGFAGLEYVSRRYKNTVNATGNDTKLELLMFLSLVAFTQPILILITTNLCAWLIPDMRGAWANFPWWAMVAILLHKDADFVRLGEIDPKLNLRHFLGVSRA